MYNVRDLNELKKNSEKFWNHEYIGRPFIQLRAPKSGVEAPEVDLSYIRKIRAAEKGDFESVVRDFDRYARSIMNYAEACPSYSIDYCPDQYAAFYGAEIEARDGESTTWIKENVADSVTDLDVGFDRNNEVLVELEKATRKAAEVADGNFLIQLPDFHSNLDAFSALLTPTNLCFDIMDN